MVIGTAAFDPERSLMILDANLRKRQFSTEMNSLPGATNSRLIREHCIELNGIQGRCADGYDLTVMSHTRAAPFPLIAIVLYEKF